ncbi:37S ribosomal protein S8, mitochondrial [Sphaceloma murrayae]|uniref:37S ribosomal protein S8, mitochondrial n=1 Tax=Sphaceloma murrayae TaxID=2082308 RepID=A0A2K1QH63_9PEZI|nr:37S ribosomal protein S8, mitochondrial [Sphaceloma murrayae]
MSLVQLANVCSHLQNASLARLGLTSIPHSRMHLSLSVQLQKQGFLSNVVLGGPSPPRKLLPPTMNESPLRFKPTPEDDVMIRAQEARRRYKELSAGSTRNPSEGQKSLISENDAVADRDRMLKEHDQAIMRLDEAEANGVEETAETEASAFPLNQLFPATNLHDKTKDVLQSEAYQESSVVTQANRASRRLWLGLKYWDGEPVIRKMKMLSKPTQRLWLTHDDLSKIIRGKRANYVDGLTRIGECLFISTDKGVMEARECVERRIGGMVLCRVYG